MNSDVDAAFEQLGREVAEQITTPIEDHVDAAEDLLKDEDLCAFALVAIRQGDDGTQTATQRVIDPEIVQNDDRDPETVVDAYHDAICHVFDEEVRDR